MWRTSCLGYPNIPESLYNLPDSSYSEKCCSVPMEMVCKIAASEEIAWGNKLSDDKTPAHVN